ncbi:MAG: hypothetical protein HZB16_13345, partial [Armatimonadetes bacterium]|nr:hypothetical protein [Armatimonadota bacterium]
MWSLALLATLTLADPVGKRPYELDWAGRTADAQPALVDFEQPADWKVEAANSEATFVRTREQQIWGDWVGRLTYRGTGGNPTVMIRPPAPVPIGKAFDAVTLWVYGNNWGWGPNPGTPQVGITA